MTRQQIPFLRGDLREAVVSRLAHEDKLRAEGWINAMARLDSLVDAEVAWQDRAKIKALIAAVAVAC